MMDREDKEGWIILVAFIFVMILFFYAMYCDNHRATRCAALGGTYLPREGVCINSSLTLDTEVKP